MPADAPVLRPFDPVHAPLVSSWAPTPAEVRAWCAGDLAPVAPGMIAGWSAEDDVEAWMLVEPGARGGPARPLAYGELWLDPVEGEVELARLIVAPSERRRGLGRQLARALAERARVAHPDLALVVLRVEPGNMAAVRAYQAAGFRRVDPATEAAWNDGQRTPWTWMCLA